MKFFLILLTVSFFSFAEEIEVKIVGSVNSEPITTFDVKQRKNALLALFPELKKAPKPQQNYTAIQHIIGEIFKKEYAKRSNITVSEGELKMQMIQFQKMLKSVGVQNVQKFIEENMDYASAEVFWNAVVEKNIAPSVQVSEELVAKIVVENAKTNADEVRAYLSQQQVEMQTNQIVDSLKKISVVEINDELLVQI